MSETSQDIIRNHMYWAIGAGSLPLPLIDLAAVTGIQLDMLKQLSRHYGVPYQEEQAKSWLSALSASLLSRLGANALKLIPGIGSILGGVSMAVLSGASTYALGQVAREHFEGRGSFEDLNLPLTATSDDIKARYKLLVKQNHPDANGGDRKSEERLREVITAYKILQKAGFC